ncbi:MAG: tRNA (adenosine(37)-N6)-threonylcarbamoyltransferase complex transferase subunit TsaD [Cytophagales bacterium]|nr:tRNA (adenosine(37)-N6)-threonylcarbamoyltransferase complex transferase subunit TsaD [Cytophagales bacterium]
MLILGIESSCDETGVALVEVDLSNSITRPVLLADELHSQIKMHQPFGGVVPELASRDHIRRVLPLTEAVLAGAHKTLADVDVVAFTQGPGLAGALLVGAGAACALGAALDVPVLGVHHLEGHLLSPFLSADPPEFPFIALLVSGGHTQLMRVHAVGDYETLGETIDDAAGEAFDKSAKLLGLDYPGGPLLARLAEQGDSAAYKLPRPLLHSGNLDFSFAGLKTAVLTQVKKVKEANLVVSTSSARTAGAVLAQTEEAVLAQTEEAVSAQTDEAVSAQTERAVLAQTELVSSALTETQIANLAASTQAAIVECLVKKSLAALASSGLARLVVAGGVGANQHLRESLNRECSKRGIRVHYPEQRLCTDNGAMIALAAALRIQAGVATPAKDYSFAVKPRWPLSA